MKTFADAEVVLAESLPGYQPREPQQTLAQWIERSMAQRLGGHTHLIAEAGTGTGKSLGYLIPAILSEGRAVVSTATKALQDQIGNKDLPFLHEHLGINFDYFVLKGRSNYVCLNRAAEGDAPADVVAAVEKAASDPDFSGERDDLGFVIEDRYWYEVNAETEDCSSLGCTKVIGADGLPTCFAVRARRRAQAAKVVVVNHALLFTDMLVAVRSGGMGSLLGPFDKVILDEAHEAENYATMMLGDRFSEYSFTKLAIAVRNAARQVGANVDAETGQIVQQIAPIWSALEEGPLGVDQLAELVPINDLLFDLAEKMRDIYLGMPNADKKFKMNVDRVANLQKRVASLIADPLTQTVRWVEKEYTRKGDSRMVIKTAPVTVAPFLREHLWPGVVGVLVSATILVDGSAQYIASRLGIEDFEDLDVGTPFDFASKARLYVPDLPAPAGNTRGEWEMASVEETLRLVRASGGRALLLYTSKTQMRNAHRSLRQRLEKDYTVLMQGEESNKVLAQRFDEDETSVLFGTASFFTGVDFQGDTCALVVMDKLPFPVPSDPIHKARMDAIERNGGNSFMDYTVPEMTLPLKQGFGRLIRTVNDMGVVAILDSRLYSKRYGKAILRSLPPATQTREFVEVEDFLSHLVPDPQPA